MHGLGCRMFRTTPSGQSKIGYEKGKRFWQKQGFVFREGIAEKILH